MLRDTYNFPTPAMATAKRKAQAAPGAARCRHGRRSGSGFAPTPRRSAVLGARSPDLRPGESVLRSPLRASQRAPPSLLPTPGCRQDPAGTGGAMGALAPGAARPQSGQREPLSTLAWGGLRVRVTSSWL